MKNLLLTLKLLSFIILFQNVTLYAKGISKEVPSYDKVYRTTKIGDSYQFFLVSKTGTYYHLNTNRTSKLTASELKSPALLEILKKKQSWGKSFPKKGKYTTTDGKLYTKLLWDRIKVVSPKKIRYLNKNFILQ